MCLSMRFYYSWGAEAMLCMSWKKRVSETEGFVPRAAGGAINISPSPDQTQWKNRESQKIKGTASGSQNWLMQRGECCCVIMSRIWASFRRCSLVHSFAHSFSFCFEVTGLPSKKKSRALCSISLSYNVLRLPRCAHQSKL
jgi:hypothetical protein